MTDHTIDRGETPGAVSAARRDILLTGAGGLAAAVLPPLPAEAQQVPAPTPESIPLRLPQTEFVYQAVVELAPAMNLGHSPLGERHMVPITGGTFEGPRIRGKVLPGGADRQLWRGDGVHQLDALYELQADNDDVITVRNKVLSDPGPPPYRFSTLQIIAPDGPNGWLNHAVFVGTLDSLAPRPAVLIRVFRVV